MNLNSQSIARQRLVRLMQEVRFGRIEDLRVGDGEPLWSLGPRVVRDIVFGKGPVTTCQPSTGDFQLKRSVAEMFKLFDHEHSFEIEYIEVQHGLPLRVRIAETAGE